MFAMGSITSKRHTAAPPKRKNEEGTTKNSTHPDDALVGKVGMGDDVDSEESVDAVLGVKSTQDHAEVPRVDGKAAQHSPAA